MRQFYVYILSSRSRNTYIGVSNNLGIRLWQHRNGLGEFTSRYRITRLVYFEITQDPYAAITREKQIKGYSRFKKARLIESINPAWNDLSESLGLTADSSLRSE